MASAWNSKFSWTEQVKKQQHSQHLCDAAGCGPNTPTHAYTFTYTQPTHQHTHSHTHTHSCVVFTVLWDCTTTSKWNRKTHICCSFAVQSERAKHVMGGLDLRETVELIDSSIHQRWHSQQRHKADSLSLAPFTWIWFDQNFKMS